MTDLHAIPWWALDWFVLRVTGGREIDTCETLGERRLAAITPREREWRNRSRYTKRKKLFEYASLPGYVFVGFETGIAPQDQPWGHILDIATVQGVLCGVTPRDDGGRRVWAKAPLRLSPGERAQIGKMIAEQIELPDFDQVAKGNGPSTQFKPDEEVIITHGAWDRFPAKCIRATNTHVRVALEMFAALREIDVPVDSVIRAPKRRR